MGVYWEMITGKSQWSYTNDFPRVKLGHDDYSKAKPHCQHGATKQNVRKYTDFAARHGFDAVFVEGWNISWEDWFGFGKDMVFDFETPYPDFDIKALNDYAHSKRHQVDNTPRNILICTQLRAQYGYGFKLIRHYGYDAVKTGYFGKIVQRGEHHYGQAAF